MDTRQMRYFVALAETLHFGQAAARMNMTQPPFSRQIANLERDLGATLVERNSRHVALTPAGERFLAESRLVLARFDAACRDARAVAEGRTGKLSFGFMMHAAHHVVPTMIRRYEALRPEVRLVLTEATPAALEERLLLGQLDAAVTFAGRAVAQLQDLPIFTDRLCVALPETHPLAARALIPAPDLAEARLIAAPARTVPMIRMAIDDHFAARGVRPQVVYEPQLQHTILRLVAAGLGVALVPASITGAAMPGVTFRPLEDAPALEVVLKTPRDGRNPAVAALVELVQEGGLLPPAP